MTTATYIVREKKDILIIIFLFVDLVELRVCVCETVHTMFIVENDWPVVCRSQILSLSCWCVTFTINLA